MSVGKSLTIDRGFKSRSNIGFVSLNIQPNFKFLGAAAIQKMTQIKIIVLHEFRTKCATRWIKNSKNLTLLKIFRVM